MQLKTKLVNRKYVGSFFNITTQTIIRWEKRGLLKPIKMGRLVYYKECDIQETINKNTLWKAGDVWVCWEKGPFYGNQFTTIEEDGDLYLLNGDTQYELKEFDLSEFEKLA